LSTLPHGVSTCRVSDAGINGWTALKAEAGNCREICVRVRGFTPSNAAEHVNLYCAIRSRKARCLVRPGQEFPVMALYGRTYGVNVSVVVVMVVVVEVEGAAATPCRVPSSHYADVHDVIAACSCCTMFVEPARFHFTTTARLCAARD
jgi:hypothetical protein